LKGPDSGESILWDKTFSCIFIFDVYILDSFFCDNQTLSWGIQDLKNKSGRMDDVYPAWRE